MKNLLKLMLINVMMSVPFSVLIALYHSEVHPFYFGMMCGAQFFMGFLSKSISEKIPTKMKKKTIELTVEQARELLGKDAAMDVLIRANFTEYELKPRVTRWEDLGRISGWYIDAYSDISCGENFVTSKKTNINLFATKEQAEGVLAMAQLSQLMKRVNGDWKPDWKDDKTLKYTIDFCYGQIECTSRYVVVAFLAFQTQEACDQFAKDHEDLILEFFKIYQ